MLALAAIKQKKTALTTTATSTRITYGTVLALVYQQPPSDDVNHSCTTGFAEGQLRGGMHITAVGHISQPVTAYRTSNYLCTIMCNILQPS